VTAVEITSDVNDPATLILMAGGGGETPIEQAMAEAYRAAARDTIERALAADVTSHIIFATDRAEWADTLSDLPVQIDLDAHPPAPFHFGRRLAGIIQHHDIRRAFYLSGGGAPLMDGLALRAVADAIHQNEGLIVTNNVHSSDWAAFTPADVAVRLADELRSDNSLGWILSRLGGLAAQEWPRTAATQFDLDTPTDLLIAGLQPMESRLQPVSEADLHYPAKASIPRIGVHLRAHITALGWDDAHIRAAAKVLMTPSRQIIIAGRLSQHTWAHLESKTQCWIRVFSEERGMRANDRQDRGLVRSLLADYLELVGLERFFREMSELGDAMFLDSRVILAARQSWPSPADRFYSDLYSTNEIADPFLRDFTTAALAAPIPVVLGGHSLVSGGLWALVDSQS